MKAFFVFIMLMIAAVGAWGEDSIKKEAKIEIRNGIKHIFNSKNPLKGDVEIKLEERLTIDIKKNSLATEKEIFFENHEGDDSGNIYLLDGKGVRIHKFNNQGKYIKSFLSKGEGPGEFGIYPKMQILQDRIYVIGPRKIAQFDLNGKYIKEVKQLKYYYSLIVIDDNHFIAAYEHYPEAKSNQFKKIIGLFSLNNEKKIKDFYKADNAGRIFVKFGNRMTSVILQPDIYPDLIHTFDFNAKVIYLTLSENYEIMAFDLTGKINMVIHRQYQNKPFTLHDKQDFVKIFGNIPGELKKQIIKKLPDKQCAITGLDTLKSQHLVVRYVEVYNQTGWDIFSKEGTYLYSIKLPPELELKEIKFYNGMLAGIEEREERNIYHQFVVKSLPDVFGKK